MLRFVLPLLSVSLFLNALAAGGAEKPEKFRYQGEGITFELTAAGHATASYLGPRNQRRVNVVVIRGEQNDLRVDPAASPYALDIKISDSDDFTIAAQSGSGHFVDQSWGRETTAVPLSLEKHQRDVAELSSFANSLQEQVKPRLGKSTFSQWLWVVDEIVDLLRYTDDQSKISPSIDDYDPKAAAAYRIVVAIKKKVAFGVVFEHSSLSSSTYKSTGQFLYSIITCNHGTCASSSTMSTKCSATFTQSTLDGYASDLLCDFYGWPYLVHVCNNDTRAEYLSIKNRSRGTWSSCSTPRLYAPPCD